MELSKNRLVIDGFIISENLHNTLTADTLFGITSKKDVHIGHDNKTWVLEGDIICDTCYNCDNCTTCVACTSCDDCTTCQACQGCTGFCTSCASGCHNTCFGDCYTCQDCQTGCTGCDGCTTNCTTGCNTSCYSCVSCQACDAACQGCDGCTAGCTGSCQTSCQNICQACVECQGLTTSFDTPICIVGCNGLCQGCTACTDGCYEGCDGSCYAGCFGNVGCTPCFGCVGCQTGCTEGCQTGCTTSCASCTGCNSCTGCTTCNGGCTGCTGCTSCDGCQGDTGPHEELVLTQWCPEGNSLGTGAKVCNSGVDQSGNVKDTYEILNQNIDPRVLAAMGVTKEEYFAMTPEEQRARATEAGIKVEVKNNTNGNVVPNKQELEAAMAAAGIDIYSVYPRVEDGPNGESTVTYVDANGNPVFSGTLDSSGHFEFNLPDGSTMSGDSSNGDITSPIITENSDGSKNTTDPNKNNESSYTPPPSQDNPNPSPQPSNPGGC